MAYRHTQSKGNAAIVAAVGLTLAMSYTFNRLSVVVGPEKVTAAFGVGIPRHSVPFDDIAAVRQVRNKWWYGFGIRKIPKGWLYNVSGLDAVELELTSGKVVRIGSDDCADLLSAVSEAVAARSGAEAS